MSIQSVSEIKDAMNRNDKDSIIRLTKNYYKCGIFGNEAAQLMTYAVEKNSISLMNLLIHCKCDVSEDYINYMMHNYHNSLNNVQNELISFFNIKQQIFQAISQQNTDLLFSSMKYEYLPYMFGPNCIPILHACVLTDNVNILSQFLSICDSYIVDCFGHTILHIAFLYKRLNCIKYIMEQFPDLSTIESNSNRLPCELGFSYITLENYALYTDYLVDGFKNSIINGDISIASLFISNNPLQSIISIYMKFDDQLKKTINSSDALRKLFTETYSIYIPMNSSPSPTNSHDVGIKTPTNINMSNLPNHSHTISTPLMNILEPIPSVSSLEHNSTLTEPLLPNSTNVPLSTPHTTVQSIPINGNSSIMNNSHLTTSEPMEGQYINESISVPTETNRPSSPQSSYSTISTSQPPNSIGINNTTSLPSAARPPALSTSSHTSVGNQVFQSLSNQIQNQTMNNSYPVSSSPSLMTSMPSPSEGHRDSMMFTKSNIHQESSDTTSLHMPDTVPLTTSTPLSTVSSSLPYSKIPPLSINTHPYSNISSSYDSQVVSSVPSAIQSNSQVSSQQQQQQQPPLLFSQEYLIPVNSNTNTIVPINITVYPNTTIILQVQSYSTVPTSASETTSVASSTQAQQQLPTPSSVNPLNTPAQTPIDSRYYQVSSSNSYGTVQPTNLNSIYSQGKNLFTLNNQDSTNNGSYPIEQSSRMNTSVYVPTPINTNISKQNLITSSPTINNTSNQTTKINNNPINMNNSLNIPLNNNNNNSPNYPSSMISSSTPLSSSLNTTYYSSSPSYNGMTIIQNSKPSTTTTHSTLSTTSIGTNVLSTSTDSIQDENDKNNEGTKNMNHLLNNPNLSQIHDVIRSFILSENINVGFIQYILDCDWNKPEKFFNLTKTDLMSIKYIFRKRYSHYIDKLFFLKQVLTEANLMNYYYTFILHKCYNLYSILDMQINQPPLSILSSLELERYSLVLKTYKPQVSKKLISLPLPEFLEFCMPIDKINNFLNHSGMTSMEDLEYLEDDAREEFHLTNGSFIAIHLLCNALNEMQ